MTKRTLSNKGRYSVLKVSGFRARMSTPQGRNIIRNRRKKGRKTLALSK
jgi:ribosomal protein L34